MSAKGAGRRTRLALRVALAVFFLVAGVLHVRSPDPFLLITPDWVPYPRFVIQATGLAELAGGAGLLLARTKKAAGLAFALYSICVFPANIKHALDNIDVPGLPTSWWYHGPRLALQPVLIWLCLYATEIVEWPFRRPGKATPSNESR